MFKKRVPLIQRRLSFEQWDSRICAWKNEMSEEFICNSLAIFIFVTGWWVFFKQTLSSIFYNFYLSHEKFLHESSWCLSLLRVVNIYSELLCFICLSSVVSMVSLNFMSIRLGRLQNILLITSCQIMN